MDEFKAFPPKHPTSKLDYLFDWAPLRNNRGKSDWLKPSEQIVSFEVAVSGTGATVTSELVDDNTAILVWMDEGTLGVEYEIQCQILTNQERDDTRTATVLIKKR